MKPKDPRHQEKAILMSLSEHRPAGNCLVLAQTPAARVKQKILRTKKEAK
ncbi:jg27227, partial [Pararge aegeria aegeria]